jgi:EpsI family protein
LKLPFNRLVILGIIVLAVQGLLTLSFSRAEYLPSPAPLSDFPSSIAPWEGVRDEALDAETLQMLSPDDVLNRQYVDADHSAELSLFVAYYKTQHKAQGAHDPKVCLPGSGWNPLLSETIRVNVPSGASFPANHYVISKGEAKAAVLYWYQSHSQIVAQQQILRLDRILDTIKDHRTDMALVRIVVPINGDDQATASDRAVQFAQSIYPYLLQQFPPKNVSN